MTEDAAENAGNKPVLSEQITETHPKASTVDKLLQRIFRFFIEDALEIANTLISLREHEDGLNQKRELT